LRKKILISAGLLAASVLVAGCSTPEGSNTNANTNATVSNTNTAPAVATTTTRPGPDNSLITSTTDSNGVVTETRVFKANPRVSKVVVTTRSGKRTARAYSSTGEEKELKDDESENALEKTGDAIATSAGFVADKTVSGTKKGVEIGKDVGAKTGEVAKTVGDKTVEGAKKVGDKTSDTAKKVGDKTADTAKTVGSKTAEGAKTVGSKTAKGAKKTGKAIKKIVTP
jgi:hypothetical protein